MFHILQIDTEDDLDERPIYCLWSLKVCCFKYKTDSVSVELEDQLCLSLDVMEPHEFDAWTVTSYWEGDSFPYSNCPLQYLAIASNVIDKDWRREVIQNHRDLADTLEISYLTGGTIQ